jgi:transcriptional regulator with XRE-family HTH domain
MATDDMERRLGEMVTARREELGLTKEAAARLAKISSITWKKVEDGEKGVMAPKYAAISNVLWADPGAIKTYLAGGAEPDALTPAEDYIADAPDPVIETMLETIHAQHPEWVYAWAVRVVEERRTNRSATKRKNGRAG